MKNGTDVNKFAGAVHLTGHFADARADTRAEICAERIGKQRCWVEIGLSAFVKSNVR